MTEPMRHYFAYGSNLWREQMRRRCPDCVHVGQGLLQGFRWIIYSRGFANIYPSDSDYVMGTVYEISPDDERRLDKNEGVHRGIYHKEVHPIETEQGTIECLVYIDSDETLGQPRDEYVDRIRRGLADANLPNDYVAQYITPHMRELD